MIDAGDADKYTLDYYTTINPDTNEPPFKYRTNYLDDALADARRIQEDGGYPLLITQADATTLNREELLGALARLNALEREQVGRSPQELAEQVIQEMDK